MALDGGDVEDNHRAKHNFPEPVNFSHLLALAYYIPKHGWLLGLRQGFTVRVS